ncbi:MAG: DUF2769 domain-containing protein [Candidatus Thorarchaeota archaeon]
MANIENWSSATFEQKYKSLMGGMTPEQQKKNVENVVHLCQCSKCPTREACGEEDLVFCIIGKLSHPVEQNGCLCSSCSLTKTMSLRWDYYCIRGSAIELSDLESSE